MVGVEKKELRKTPSRYSLGQNPAFALFYLHCCPPQLSFPSVSCCSAFARFPLLPGTAPAFVLPLLPITE